MRAASPGRSGSMSGATAVTMPCAKPAVQPGSLLCGRRSISVASVTPASRAYVRPTVCMIPWQSAISAGPSFHALPAIASTAGRGSSGPRTAARYSRV